MKKLFVVLALSALTLTACEDYNPVPVEPIEPQTGMTYVDLGLSVLWAECNLGASRPDEFGDYYSWGELEPYYKKGYAQYSQIDENTFFMMNEVDERNFSRDTISGSIWKEGKNGYTWESYRLCAGDMRQLTKYNVVSPFYGKVDGKLILEPDDDIAYQKLQGEGRMATLEEWKELVAGCEWEWCASAAYDSTEAYTLNAPYMINDKYGATPDDPRYVPTYKDGWVPYVAGDAKKGGVWGYRLTSKNPAYEGASLFLPAAGIHDIYKYDRPGLSSRRATAAGYYWTSTVNKALPFIAWSFGINEIKVNERTDPRNQGFSIRAVKEK